MKKKKGLIAACVICIVLVGLSTAFAFNKAQEANQKKTELAQKKVDKENKEKQDKILAEKKKLEEEKKKLEEEQKAKQDELDRLQAEKESISRENEANQQAVQEQETQVVQQPAIQPEVETPPSNNQSTTESSNGNYQPKHPENWDKPAYTWEDGQRDGLTSEEYMKKVEEMYQ